MDKSKNEMLREISWTGLVKWIQRLKIKPCLRVWRVGFLGMGDLDQGVHSVINLKNSRFIVMCMKIGLLDP